MFRSRLQPIVLHQICRWSSQSSLEITSLSNGVTNVVLNKPKARNCLSMDVLAALSHVFNSSQVTSSRCIVLRANGPVFSSGHNLKELGADSYEKRLQTFEECGKLMTAITAAPIPVIAAVDGLAAAAGCQLIASCDIVVATKRSQFSTPGANVGIFCCGPGVAVSRSVGRKGAAKMLLTGLPVTAEEALNIGLISAVCENDKLDETVDQYVNAILSKSRAVIELGKRFYYKQLTLDLVSAYREAAKEMADNLNLADGEEGIRSFVEKRKPVWKHTP